MWPVWIGCHGGDKQGALTGLIPSDEAPTKSRLQAWLRLLKEAVGEACASLLLVRLMRATDSCMPTSQPTSAAVINGSNSTNERDELILKEAQEQLWCKVVLVLLRLVQYALVVFIGRIGSACTFLIARVPSESSIASLNECRCHLTTAHRQMEPLLPLSAAAVCIFHGCDCWGLLQTAGATTSFSIPIFTMFALVNVQIAAFQIEATLTT